MRILVGCECSGRVREAFKKRGHDAWSCDLKPTDIPGQHLQMDIFEAFEKHGPWDMLVCFPDCTYLCVSGLHWNKKDPVRREKTEQALQFVQRLMDLPVERFALENPVGCISSRICKPSQIIQPYQFGDDASKKTCLWLRWLPLLKPTLQVPGRIVNGKERWSNQTDSGQNKLGPSEERELRLELSRIRE